MITKPPCGPVNAGRPIRFVQKIRRKPIFRIHRGNCTKNKLYNDTEKRKRIRKVIKAPYSQGDVVVFGQNARQECVAMNLCALILHNMKGIGILMT